MEAPSFWIWKHQCDLVKTVIVPCLLRWLVTSFLVSEESISAALFLCCIMGVCGIKVSVQSKNFVDATGLKLSDYLISALTTCKGSCLRDTFIQYFTIVCSWSLEMLSSNNIFLHLQNYTQYIPLSIYDLQTWMGSPSIFVYDCSNAGIIVKSFKQFALQREQELEVCNMFRFHVLWLDCNTWL